MYAVKATGTLRISKEGELEGLDLHEHGGVAYPELTDGIGNVIVNGAGAAYATAADSKVSPVPGGAVAT
jgi:hypothetical protein